MVSLCVKSPQRIKVKSYALLPIGETTWAKKGRFTGKTDIALTEEGEAQVSHAATKAVGPGKLIDPQGLGTIYVSPRLRAKQTLDLLVPDAADRGIIRNEIEEWDYGHYEGLTIDKIKELRRTRGLDKDEEWNIWSDGCEGGESKEQVTDRLDRLISEVRQIQKASMDGRGAADILIVAHGLILRCFAKRWIGFEIDASLELMMDPGAIAVLSYKNKDIDKPAIHLGMAL
ncbi:putative phosphoglycerate mutase [Emericellopsis atlantica]|uniref:Phosphoglycerate mutase n=1 Tax=Emericellopsis atlantica TaxID=2614577 RepID=A0A9P7ZDZ2_9HYPO|nr:putative phosphoglycerate mutase [Emericellopsis atlantica]KAG9249708.1 putative phosphoglycerate mutase [Emericellopsis atlantica]